MGFIRLRKSDSCIGVPHSLSAANRITISLRHTVLSGSSVKPFSLPRISRSRPVNPRGFVDLSLLSCLKGAQQEVYITTEILYGSNSFLWQTSNIILIRAFLLPWIAGPHPTLHGAIRTSETFGKLPRGPP